MDILGRLILRLILVPLGVVIALAVAGAAFMVVFMVIGIWIASPPGPPHDPTPLFVILNLFALSFAKTTYNLLLSMFLFYAFMVAAIGVLISETFAVRSWIFHVANGALSAWTLV